MEKRCTFCGKELGFLERDVLGCGGTDQPCCKSCHKKMVPLSMVERCQRALQTGRAVDWRTMQGFLEQHQQGEETAKRQAEQHKQQRRTGKNCLRCGAPMLSVGKQTFKLGEETFFFSDWNRLFSGSLDLEMEVCKQCRKVEFFLPEGVSLNLNER